MIKPMIKKTIINKTKKNKTQKQTKKNTNTHIINVLTLLVLGLPINKGILFFSQFSIIFLEALSVITNFKA